MPGRMETEPRQNEPHLLNRPLKTASFCVIPACLPGTDEDDLSLLPQFLYPALDGFWGNIQCGGYLNDSLTGIFLNEFQ